MRAMHQALFVQMQSLTWFGKVLRSLSLGEIPQLINVLRGDMSVVGPRPLLTSYLPLYSAEEARRHDVKPGMTGWAQVNGRNQITWSERLRLDTWYVDNHRMLTDIQNLLGHIDGIVRFGNVLDSSGSVLQRSERKSAKAAR